MQTSTADRLCAEATETVRLVEKRRYAQRLLNVIMLLAIGALFILVMSYKVTPNFDAQNTLVLKRVCEAADQSKLSPSDKLYCSDVEGAYGR